MKKLFFILAVLVLAARTYAQKEITSIVTIEGGYKKIHFSHYYYDLPNSSPKFHEPTFYSDITMGFEYKGFRFSNSIQTYFKPNIIELRKPYHQSAPVLTRYDLDFKYSKGNYTIGYGHSCTHLIKSSRTEYLDNTRLALGYDKIFFLVKIK